MPSAATSSMHCWPSPNRASANCCSPSATPWRNPKVAMQLVLASGNPGKVEELRELLRDAAFELRAQSHYGVVDVEETATTFVENALLKARHAARETGLPAMADDS